MAVENRGLDPVRKELEAVIRMGHRPAQVFDDWVALMFHAFQRDEPEYLGIVGKYRNDAPVGEREVDHMANALGALMLHMKETGEEGLSPLFMEYAANPRTGQFCTPSSVADMMARIAAPADLPEEGPITVHDPACGAGVTLVAMARTQTAEQNDRTVFSGVDTDLTCVRMTALNLMFFNLNGWVVWGNALSSEVRGAWQTVRNVILGGSLRPLDAEEARRLLAAGNGRKEREEQP